MHHMNELYGADSFLRS